jgi:hypothetical protein
MRLNFRFNVLTAMLFALGFAVLFGPHSIAAAQFALAHAQNVVSDPSALAFGIGMSGIMIGDISQVIAPFPTIPELLAIKMAYKNPSLIADNVFPRIKVGSQKFMYIVYDKGDTFRIPGTLVGRTGVLNNVQTKATLQTDSCESYGLKELVPQDDIDNAASSGMDPLAIATSMISSWVALDREKRVADLAFDAGNYDANHKKSLIAAEYWDAKTYYDTTANPIDHITAALDACIMRPQFMAIGRLAFTALAKNGNILKAVHGNLGNAGVATRQQIADLFELQNIYVGESFMTSSKKGQAATFARVWGKSALLYYSDPNIMRPDTGITYGFTAAWKQFAGAMFEKDIGAQGGQEVRAGEYVKEHIMASDCAYLLDGVIA